MNLVISHKRRVSINSKVQAARIRRERPAETLQLPASKHSGLNATQNMVLWQGVPLTAVLDGLSKYGIYNNQLLTVKTWDEKSLQVECQEGGELYEISHDFCKRSLRLAYSMTYASIQARTCTGTVALWDTKHPKFSRRHLAMGMSRAQRAVSVWLSD